MAVNLQTPAACSAQATHLFADAPRGRRMMQRYRPYICPFHLLIDYVPAGATVLDVGCGSGLFLGLLTRCGRISRGVGFDSDPQAIAAAQMMSKRIENPGNAALTLEHRGVNDPWPEEMFDVVSLIDVMHHVPIPARRELVVQLCRHMRPGGRLIYKDIAPRPLWRAWANRLHDLTLARQWVSYESPQRVVQWCAEEGLRLIASRRVNMLWYGHDLRVWERSP